MIGSLVGLATGAYGKKPKVPALPKIDLTENQLATVSGNQATLPEAEKLATKVNAFNVEQLNRLQKSIFPQYQSLFDRAAGVASDQLKGHIPTDVADYVRRQSVAGSFGSGTFGSGFARAGEARNLGLTSLSMVNEGLSKFSGLAAMSRALMPTPFDVSSMFLTPTQRYSMQNEQNLQQFQRQMTVNEIKAAGDPGMQALSAALDNFESQLMSMAGGYFGARGSVAANNQRAFAANPNIGKIAGSGIGPAIGRF